jgi:cyclic beta-1,2-glucan synthetase
VALFGVTGFLAGWSGFLWLGFGLQKKVLREYARFVLPGEGLVVIKETEGRATDVIAVLRSIGNPSVFVIRPGLRLAPSTEPDGTMPEAISLGGLPNCGAELAASNQLDPSTESRSLLPILRDCEIGIESARADLAEATRLDYGITHAADWLLDNAYLIRSHIADIRHDCPTITTKSCRCSQTRMTPCHCAPKTPLTIAELWVFPLMLRLLLLQRLRRLSELTSLRQHQRELANFWADRLLNAANRSADQFDRIVAELDRDGHELTPHFIARLGDQLHKEESALAPIHKWIEEKTKTRLADIILCEHAAEANDLMLITSAIGSLRQLSELQYPKIVEAVSRIEAILSEDPPGIHAHSDFATRDRSRCVVEEVARQSKTSEWIVERLAVELAQQAPLGSREGCIAYYLLDDGLPILEKRIARRVSWRLRKRRFLYRHATTLYLGESALSGRTQLYRDRPTLGQVAACRLYATVPRARRI